MEEEDFWKWHKNLLNKLTEGFNKYTERFYLFEAGSKNDIEREGYKRDRLCLKLFSSRLDITSCYLELIEKGNYYSAYIILCTLIENIIIGCYIFSNKSALDDFTLFATIEDLKKIKSQDESIKTEILRILKMDYYQASLDRLKKDKNKVFSSDADYMNRENYKKDWKPTVKVMSDESDGEDLYNVYSELCNYKHCNPQLLALSFESKIACLDGKIFADRINRLILDMCHPYHYLFFLELNIIFSVKAFPGLKEYFSAHGLEECEEAIKKMDNNLTMFI